LERIECNRNASGVFLMRDDSATIRRNRGWKVSAIEWRARGRFKASRPQMTPRGRRLNEARAGLRLRVGEQPVTIWLRLRNSEPTNINPAISAGFCRNQKSLRKHSGNEIFRRRRLHGNDAGFSHKRRWSSAAVVLK
jgi:hypothetical protein